MKLKAAIVSASLVASAFTSVAQGLAPDIIIVNAVVRTMDPKQPTAEAIAISGNKIAVVGSNDAVRKLVGAATRTIDAGGKLVLPGFNDSHVHFMDGGFSMSNVDLRTAKTPEEFAQRIG